MFADVGMVSGHVALADFFYLVAAIIFVIAAVITVRPPHPDTRPFPTGWLMPIGLALVAAGLFVT